MLLSETLLPLICVLRGPAGRRVLDARRGRWRGRGRLGGFSRARRGGRHHDVSTAAPVRVRWSYVPLRSDDVRRVCGAGRGAQGQLFYQSTVEILLDC